MCILHLLYIYPFQQRPHTKENKNDINAFQMELRSTYTTTDSGG